MFPNFIIRHGLACLTVAVISLVTLEASSPAFHHPANREVASIMTMKDDLANRSSEIHWPPGFDTMPSCGLCPHCEAVPSIEAAYHLAQLNPPPLTEAFSPVAKFCVAPLTEE